MGLLNAAGVNNGFTDWIAGHRGALTGLGVGLANGNTLSSGIGLATQGLARGAVQDDAYATQQKTEKDRLDQINKTAEFLRAKGREDLIPLLDAGQANLALTQALAPPKAPDLTEVSAGSTLYDPIKGAAIYTAPNKPSAGSIPSGYRPTKDGNSLEPIPGGPADPASAQALSPDALDLIATQYLAGDKSVVQGYARNANMRAQISNAIAEKAAAAGMDGKAIAAEVSAYGGNVAAQRAAGTRAAQVGMAASEASQMADIALTASKSVPRGNFVPWNALQNAVATGTSSPEMAKFVTATTSLVNAYARAVSPLGAPTDAMRQHAEAMLNTAQGPEAYAAVIDQMKQEMEAALNAPAEVSDRLKTNITGEGAKPGAAPLTGKTSSGLSWSLN